MADQPAPVTVKYELTQAEREAAGRLMIKPEETAPVRKYRSLKLVLLLVIIGYLLSRVGNIQFTPISEIYNSWKKSLIDFYDAPDFPLRCLFISGACGFAVSLKILFGASRKLQDRVHALSTLTIHPEGLTWNETGMRRWMKWSSFQNFQEGNELFILRTSEHSSMAIPKRLFKDEKQLGEARMMLAANLVQFPHLRAFPVLHHEG